jgi:ABC-2 type transport system ATP-binding protein
VHVEVDAAEAPLALEARDVWKAFERTQALSGVSFALRAGEIHALVGANGAGKSTLIKILLGLSPATEGSARVLGLDIATEGAAIRERVGYMPEHDCLPPDVSATEFVVHMARMSGLPPTAARERTADILRHVGLYEERYRPIGGYSTGMKQRVKLAQALVHDPKLVFLDEPTNGLDPHQIREMRTVITRYAAGGRTVIVSSHLLAEVEQTCTHLVVMDHGRLLAAGPVETITGAGEHLLIGVAPGALTGAELDAVATKIAALDGVATAETVERGLLVRLDGMPLTGLLAELLRLEVPVESVGPYRRLEDAFLTLTGDPA